MTEAFTVQTDLSDSNQAGRSLGTQIAGAFGDAPPDVVLLFASARYDYAELLPALDDTAHPRFLVGCSSAGEFSSAARGEGSACAVALRSSELHFRAGIGRGLRGDRAAAAKQLVESFQGIGRPEYRFRTALVLTDALAGYADNLVEQLTLLTAGTYQFFGGGAGDDARFERTHVFFGREAIPDAVVALEILSNKPIGIGVGHGWEPASTRLRVTEVDGMRLGSLNAIPAAEVFQDHAEETGQPFDRDDPLPFFLHNVIGIETPNGHRLRVPLAINPDESIVCAADIPNGSTVHIMNATGGATAAAAIRATEAALRQLNGLRPKAAIFFDCVATRLRLGREFGDALDSVQAALGPAVYAGFNTYGQIARAEGQFGGFHNCTAVVCVIPE